ncbi:MAG: hypothetical protein GKR97_18280 [Rhizobiaceae bacterium]|nr:hypothetical protein [Rhizobiaceae bacterium]
MDLGLGFVGLCLAGGSSYLPYYVYHHESEFGPPVMEFTGRIDYGEPLVGEQVTEARNPLFKQLAELAQVGVIQSNAEFENVDSIVTGSIQPRIDGIPRLRQALRPSQQNEQRRSGSNELVEHASFRMVFATRERALIRDGDDLLPVAVGSRLPDGSTVKSLSRGQGGWQLLTSNNHVLKLVY